MTQQHDDRADGDSNVDVAEQLREALRFLSHDAREGHSSTLALLELHRVRSDSMASSDLAQRIERNARRSLMRIDDFVSFARARSTPMNPQELDLLDLVYDAVAESWHAGNERGVRLKVGQAPSEAVLQADRALLRAAIARLIQHALDACRRGSDLVCTVHEEPQRWRVEFDETQAGGENDAPPASQPVSDGQYGWALVELVIKRMGGTAEQLANSEFGVRFRASLPRP